MGTTGRRVAAVLAAMAALGWFAWALRPEPVRVETARAETGELLVTIDEEGELRARDRYVVAAPVAGRLERIALRDGDAVAAGAELARIWPLPLSPRERAEQGARLAAAGAAVAEAEARLARADTEHRQARRERARVEALVAAGYVSAQAAEQARAEESARGDERAAARSRVEVARAERAAVAATLIALEAQAGAARSVPVLAPAAARVLRIVDRSERVVAAGAPLLTLGDPAQLEAVVDLLSQDAVRVRPGMAMRVAGWGGERVLAATVRSVEPFAFTKVSALGVEEQRVNVVADLAEPSGPLGDGYRFEARIVVGRSAAALRVPLGALFQDGERWALFEVSDGRAWRREVTVGLRNAVHAEILDGLAAGAEVVRHPDNAVGDGLRVRSARN